MTLQTQTRMTPQTSNCLVFSERLVMNLFSINVELESTQYKYREQHGSQNVIGGSCHKCNFCRYRHVFVATNYIFCRDKTFVEKHFFFFLVATKLLSREIFVAASIILLQQRFCRDKLILSQQTRACRDKTRLLSRQKCACRDEYVFVTTNICHDKNVLSRQT